ncbi:hypothetical protein ABK040_012301 [Willaertia magna]
MKIGVLGVGPVGEELAKAFARNHEIKLGTRDTTSEKIKKALERVGGSQTTIGTYEETVNFADVVILTTPWSGTLDTVKALANQLNVNSKIVIDATNPIASFQPLTMDVGASTSTSGAEEIQKLIPNARVVKAYNSTGYQNFDHPQGYPLQPDMFYCGGDEEAKKIVSQLITETGLNPVDCGALETSRFLEPLAFVWINHAFFMGNGLDWSFKLMKKQ